ncbi:hypothetical protein BS17DRAFT_770768 [Gyrodon lividus]|nr:hypothetical protein BS17DRAFT_770768 [Gyrodon lividus]
MVKWLVDHPIDCIMLFHEDRSTPHPEGQASGRTKLEICAIVSELVFKDDEEYAPLFATHAAKFAKAIQDHLGILTLTCINFTQTEKKAIVSKLSSSCKQEMGLHQTQRITIIYFRWLKNNFCGTLIFTLSGGASPHTP